MTRPSNIPPPGSPLRGLSEVLSDVAGVARADDMPGDGVFGDDGTKTPQTPPWRAAIACFKITGDFTNDDLPDGSDWPTSPNNTWYYAPATRVEYYPDSGNWSTPSDEGDDATTPDDEYVWDLNYVPGSSSGSSGSSSGSGNPSVGSLVYCSFDESAGVWVIISGGGGGGTDSGTSTIMQATLTADCDPTSGTASFSGAYPVDGKSPPMTLPTSAYNTGWLGKSGAILTIGLSNSGGSSSSSSSSGSSSGSESTNWYVIAIAPPYVTKQVVTDDQLSGLNIQHYLTTIVTFANSDYPDTSGDGWATWTVGDQCTSSS